MGGAVFIGGGVFYVPQQMGLGDKLLQFAPSLSPRLTIRIYAHALF